MEEIKLQVGVKALLKNSEGKFLLLRRNMDLYPSVFAPWDIVGGRIEPGKPLFENLAREIDEETGLKLRGEPKLIAAQDILRKPGYHVVRLTFIAEVDGDIPRLSEEHDDYKHVSISELKEMSENELDNYLKELLDKGLFD